MTITPKASGPVSDDEVIEHVTAYLDSRGLPSEGVTPESSLAALGIDSISLVELLLDAREQLIEAGKLPPGVTLTNLPTLESVQDLIVLLRGLASQGS